MLAQKKRSHKKEVLKKFLRIDRENEEQKNSLKAVEYKNWVGRGVYAVQTPDP